MTTSTPLLRIDCDGDSRRFRVALAGVIDLSTVGRLERALQALPCQGGELTLDLAEVCFIDSAGLRAILIAHRRCLHGGCLLTIANPAAQVLDLLDVPHQLSPRWKETPATEPEA